MATYRKGKIEAIEKEQTLRLQMDLPMTELIAGVRDDIEALAAQIGLTIMACCMAQIIDNPSLVFPRFCLRDFNPKSLSRVSVEGRKWGTHFRQIARVDQIEADVVGQDLELFGLLRHFHGVYELSALHMRVGNIIRTTI